MEMQSNRDFAEKLKTAEEKAEFYQLIADNTYDWEVFRDSHGKIVYVNSAFERITGYKKQDLLDEKIQEKDIVHTDDWGYAKSIINSFGNKEEVADFEFRIITKDNKTRYINLNASPVFTHGKFMGTRISMRDITNQKNFSTITHTHKALVLSENRFKTYIENSPTAVFLANNDGRFTYANPSACNLLDYTQEELLKMFIYNIIPKRDRNNALKNKLTTTNNKEIHNFTVSLKKRNGDLVDVVLDSRKLNDNEYIAFVKDMSQLRKTELILKEQNAEYEAMNEELRQTNQELYELQLKSEESKLQYERLFENMEQGFALHQIIYDKEGVPCDYRFLLMNAAFEKLTGLKSENAVGKTVLDLLPNTEREWIEIYGKVAMTGQSYHFENYSREMNAFYEVVAYSPQQGQFAVIFSDVSELKYNYKLLEQAKKEAEESEARFKTLQNASFGGIYLHAEGIIFDCNQALSDISGYSRDELIGMNSLLLVSESSRELMNQKIKQSSQTPYEAIGVRKNGTEFPVRLEGRNIPFKGKTARSVEVRDISDYKNALKVATDNKEYLELFINSGPDLFFLKDRNLRYIITNKATNDLLKRTADEIIGKCDKDIMPSQLANWSKTSDLKAIEKKTIVKNIEIINNTAYEIWKIPVFKNKNLVGLAGIIRDVSKQIEAEKALTIAKEKAERGEEELHIKNQEYEALNEELRQSNEELFFAKQHAEESSKLKTAFLNNISHEFRTPMNGILGFSELLIRPQKTENQRSKYITIIRENCNRLLDLVTDTVELSSIQSGTIKLNKESILITSIIDDLIKVTQPLADKKNLDLIIANETNNKQQITTDRYKIYRLLKHLLTNALKFTITGFVKFTCLTDGNQLIIKIEDTGVGMNNTLLENIYEPYKQPDSNEFHNTGGTGIGLSLVKAYTDMLGGQIGIESELNIGTKIKLTFPL